jgi:two-component system sensor histidine kinase CiaH
MTKFFRFRNFSFWFWVLFTYVVAALIWWYISLEKQNEAMTTLRLEKLQTTQTEYLALSQKILEEKHRNTTKHLSEGITFLLLIIIGAVVVYRSVRKQISYASMQRNFMMAVTHELKTPIATTRLSLETLKQRQLETAQQHKLLDNALSETSRLDVLTNNILLASQIEEKEYVQYEIPFSLSTLVEHVLQDYTNRFPARMIQSSIEKELWLLGDERMIQIAISNLIDNALKYSSKADIINIKLHHKENQLILQVIDQGEGIPDKEKKKIFQKFYRLGNESTRKTKGTGLGLYLTKKIIENHNGALYVKDHHPKGSIFVMELKKHADT